LGIVFVKQLEAQDELIGWLLEALIIDICFVAQANVRRACCFD
jgi:hypothetical protein